MKADAPPVEIYWLIDERGVEESEKNWRERGSLCQFDIR